MVSGSIENQSVKMDDNHLSIKLGKNLVIWDLPKSPSINNPNIEKILWKM